MVIERTSTADFDEVKAVLRECGLPEGNLCAADMGRFLVARSGRCVVGVAGMIIQGSCAVGHSLAVVPGFRGMGLGRLLANGLLDWSSTLGLGSIYLFTCQAEFYFRAMGFSVVEQGEVPETILMALSDLCDPGVFGAGHILHFRLETIFDRLAAGAENYGSYGIVEALQ
jgi:N-acetylglutamate synthase-like GNAT family acetyltransferase